MADQRDFPRIRRRRLLRAGGVDVRQPDSGSIKRITAQAGRLRTLAAPDDATVTSRITEIDELDRLRSRRPVARCTEAKHDEFVAFPAPAGRKGGATYRYWPGLAVMKGAPDVDEAKALIDYLGQPKHRSPPPAASISFPW
jgi:hypothetical protein